MQNKLKGKIFSAQEVQAIMSGSKVMFREVIKPQPDNARQQFSTIASSTMRGESGKHRFVEVENLNIITHTKSFKCPYQVGQKIFCKESFAEVEVGAGMGYVSGKQTLYRAVDDYDVKWKPAQYMKQEHSRLTLLIKKIRVERLGEISEEDCDKEGVGYTGGWNGIDYDDGEFYFGKLACSEDEMSWKNEMFEYPDLAFADNWNATHKKPEEKFEASPWVWCISFSVINN